MALTKCQECGHDVSTEANECPNCGFGIAKLSARNKSRKLIIATIVIILIVGSAGILYRQYTRSPEYSFRKAKKAVEQHDVVSFEKYVDVEGISNGLIDQLINMEKEETKSQDEWEQLGELIGKGLAMLLKPRI